MKNKNKKLIAVLSACCMATAVAAFATGCGKDKKKENNDQTYAIYQLYVAKAEDAGENALSYDDWLAAIKGEKGATGATGKSAYEIAVDNGFEGTEEEWLASLKGDPGKPAHEHTYDEDVEPITIIEPTLTKKGFGYKTCESCDHIEPVIVGITEIKEGEPITVKNNGEAILLQIPSVSKEGKLELEVVDAYGEKVSASYTAYCILDGNPTQWPTNGTYYKGDNCVVSITYKPTYDKERTLTITAVILDGTEEYEHVVTVASSDGTAGGATSVQAYKGSELIAEAPVENGIATLSMPAGTYDLKVVGLGDDYKAVDTVTDGKRGGSYTIQLTKSYTYTVTVKNGDQLLNGATVNVTKATGIQGGAAVYDSGSQVVQTLETVDGVATFTVEEVEYVNYSNNYNHEYGFHYQVSFTVDGLAIDEEPCAPVKLYPNETNVTLTVKKKDIKDWALGTAVSVAGGATEAIGKITLAAEEVGEYEITFDGTGMHANQNYKLNINGTETTVSGSSLKATVTLGESNVISITPANAGDKFFAFTVTVAKPVVAEENELLLGEATTATGGKTYTFKATEDSAYKLTISGSVDGTSIYASKAGGTAFITPDDATKEYQFILAAGMEQTFYVDSADDITMTVTKVAATTLTAGSISGKTVTPGTVYTFKPTYNGSYTFTFSGLGENDTASVWTVAEWLNLSTGAPMFDTTEAESMVFTTGNLVADQTYVYVMDHNSSNAVKVAVAEGNLYTEMTLDAEAKVAVSKYSFTATEAGTYYLTATTLNLYGINGLTVADAPTDGNVLWESLKANYYEFTLEEGETFEFYLTKKFNNATNRLYITKTQPGA